MIKTKSSLSAVKNFVSSLSQKRVHVTLNLGRNKFFSFTGTLTGVYQALFTVRPDDKKLTCKTSYSYAEYLCGKVKISQAESS